MYDVLDDLKAKLDARRPFSEEQTARIDEVLTPLRIYYTIAFEDNSLTLEETRYYLESNRMVGGKLEREFHEVKGVSDAIGYLRSMMANGEELSEENILKLHEVLSSPIEQEERYFPGKYKIRDMHIIGQAGSRINFARHDRVPAEMQALLSWYGNAHETLHPVELAARFHYRFALIHPFTDGNGRVARLLDDFILEKVGYGPAMVEEQERYFAAIQAADSKLPVKDRITAAETVDLTHFIESLRDSSQNSMQQMLTILDEPPQPAVKDIGTRLQIFDKILSGNSTSETDRKLLEEKEATKLAIGREISERLKGKVESKFVQFHLSGPVKFHQNNHEYSPLISEVARRHQYTFSPNESLYEFHFAPDLEAVEQAGMPMEPFMKLMSFAIISHEEFVGVFTGVLTFEFGRVYIKQENREEIILKLDEESIREVIDGSSYEEWDIAELNKLVFESLDAYFQSIETDYLASQKGSD
jgi:Fic family protein